MREVCAGAFVEAPEGRCASVELVFWRETLGGARHPEVQRFSGDFSFGKSLCNGGGFTVKVAWEEFLEPLIDNDCVVRNFGNHFEESSFPPCL